MQGVQDRGRRRDVHGASVVPSMLGEVMVARQPLVSPTLEVVGYELLYRDADGHAPTADDGSRATARVVIDGMLGTGHSVVGEGEDAYLNVPAPLLLSDVLIDLPAARLVLEVLEGVDLGSELRQAITRHRQAGFRVALDDVVPGDPRLGLLDVVDVVKVDLLASGTQDGLALIRQLSAAGHLVVAEKVENPLLFDEVVAAGAALVQGFFFTRPRAVRSMRPLPLGPGHLALLDAFSVAGVDLARVEQLIRSDLTLADRFLRLVDASSGWKQIGSIRDGLMMLGESRVRRWATLLVLSAGDEQAPGELLTLASMRARYCELLAERTGSSSGLDAFSVGMFSVLGTEGRLDEVVLDSLPLSSQARCALQGRAGPLRDLVRIQLAAEAADWDELVRLGRRLDLSPRELANAHVQALHWSAALAGVSGPAPVPGAASG